MEEPSNGLRAGCSLECWEEEELDYYAILGEKVCTALVDGARQYMESLHVGEMLCPVMFTTVGSWDSLRDEISQAHQETTLEHQILGRSTTPSSFCAEHRMFMRKVAE